MPTIYNPLTDNSDWLKPSLPPWVSDSVTHAIKPTQSKDIIVRPVKNGWLVIADDETYVAVSLEEVTEVLRLASVSRAISKAK